MIENKQHSLSVMDQTCYSSLSGFTDDSRLSSDDSDLILLIEFDFLSLWRSDSAELGGNYLKFPEKA